VRAKRLLPDQGSTAGQRELARNRGWLMTDWLGVQFTGGGGTSTLLAFLLVGLLAIRTAPYLVWRAAGWVARRR
jgi:hypothetical protein